MAYDEQGYVHILHSTFFDVDPEVDHTVEGYVARILDTLVDAIKEQLGVVQWRIASNPQADGAAMSESSARALWMMTVGAESEGAAALVQYL
ncbi:hypothetical protein M5K25_009086 [Dendrobium thyrsiflorum]|uniref:Uncharacterized protein n=1 Tax=Dendrobium thyrsiflorum TaxID=117978 RepID=A0ABD0V4K5_DENTH